MIRISLFVSDSHPITRQIDDNPIHDSCVFTVNNAQAHCDCVFILDNVIQPLEIRCVPANIFLVVLEPPFVRMYESNFLSQFGHILTFHKSMKKNVIHTFPLLPWFDGLRFEKETKSWNPISYLTRSELSKPIGHKKLNKIAIISSNKTFTKGHKKRMEFTLWLKSKLPDKIDIYGNGFLPVEDKYEVLSKYKYSLVIENCIYPDYWTEKISDAFIAECLPFYIGCPNLTQYFDARSFVALDIHSFDKALSVVKKMLEKNAFDDYKRYILVSKRLVLNEYNLFTVISHYAHLYYKEGADKIICIQPEKRSFFQKLKIKLALYYPYFVR